MDKATTVVTKSSGSAPPNRWLCWKTSCWHKIALLLGQIISYKLTVLWAAKHLASWNDRRYSLYLSNWCGTSSAESVLSSPGRAGLPAISLKQSSSWGFCSGMWCQSYRMTEGCQSRRGSSAKRTKKGTLCKPHSSNPLFKSNSKSHSKTSLTQWEPGLDKNFKLRPLIRTITRGQRQQDLFHLFLTRMKLISVQKISLRIRLYLNSCKTSVVHLINHWLDS